MRLMRVGDVRRRTTGPCSARTGQLQRPERSVTADIDGAFLATDGIARIRAAQAALPAFDAPACASAPRSPGPAVLCIGLNYAAHAAESGAAAAGAPDRSSSRPRTPSSAPTTTC